MDPAKCLANARVFDPPAVLCSDARCNGGASKYLDARCHCRPPYTQNPCPYSADSPVWIDDGTPNGCYCCCSCFAYGTPVAYAPGEFKAIETYAVGEKVLVATTDLEWSERVVEFSSGVHPSPENGKTVITVYYDLGNDPRTLVVTPDHVFFTSDKKLKRAEQLEVGTDMLVDAANGKPVKIIGKETGAWFKGLHHIATTQDAATDPDGHLLNSNGIVTGDWALQIGNIPDHAKVAAAPEPAWGPQKPVARSTFSQIKKGFKSTEHRPHGFIPYAELTREFPDDAQGFFSPEQAKDIYNKVKQYPPSVIGIQEPLFFLFRQLHSYYPDVFFDLHWDEPMPNVHSFRQYGVNFVVLNGGLARSEGVGIDALMTILASATGRIAGGAPLVPDTMLSCVGQGDYFATLAVLRNIMLTADYRTRTAAGYSQVAALFNQINPDHRGGLLGNTCNDISTDCRLQAFTAGRGMEPLPACAGGPRVDFLQVVEATAKRALRGIEVRIKFNEELNKPSAEERQNYSFDPAAKISSVKVAAKDPNTVVIKTALDPKVTYRLTLENILSESGDPLENDQGVVEVKVSK